MMLKRTPSDNRMIHFKQINLHPFISWRFKKNPFLSHLDSLPQTPYNKREKSIPRRVFEASNEKGSRFKSGATAITVFGMRVP